MIRNVLEYLERSAGLYPDKPAFVDDENALTFGRLMDRAKRIGSALSGLTSAGKPVPVCMKKSPDEIAAFMGIVYAGCPYVPIDPQMPEKRIERIIRTIEADVMIADSESRAIVSRLDCDLKLFSVGELEACEINGERLRRIRRFSIDCDPLYIIFTSGSTGDPKGVALSHRAVIDFTEWFSETVRFDSDSVFGNQAPFYFDMSVKDIYSTLKNGATTYIIPKRLFSFPADLFRYINENGINTLAWAVSAVCLAAKENAFEKEAPRNIRAVCFGGEAMPVNLLRIWQKYVPDAMYMNMYGPTETAVDCTYHIIDPDRDYASGFYPAGYPCENTGILILNGDRPAAEGEVGEICVRGTALALGYYNDSARTEKVFTRNPLQGAYSERIYRTGDMGYFNAAGEIVFASRKDDQIKHMGYRIELGEIETALSNVPGITRCCCLFDRAADKIVCVYTGSAVRKEIILEVSKYIPKYMWPNTFVQLDELPMTLNGKIDRVALKKQYAGG